MDNKDEQKNKFFNNQNNWKALGFFSAEEYFIYVFKKTEKIIAGLYLVSGLLKDDEPMKWQLRDKGMSLLSSSFSASNSLPGDRNAVIQSIFTSALETISLLNVARISNLISEMNHNLLVREIDNVVALMKDKLTSDADNAGYVLSEKFFKTPDFYTTGFKINGERGRKYPSFHGSYGENDGLERQSHVDMKEKKNQRQQSILSLLKDGGGLTVKDFLKVIKDCSLKTIQRELIELVNQGVVKKEGERRWSRYSLV